MPDMVMRWRELRRTIEDEGIRRRGLLVGLDFDGTLSAIVRHPRLARIAPATRRLLGRLACAPNTSLAVLSGRALPDVARRIGLRGVYYAGNHGLEIRGPRVAWRHPKALSATGDIRALGRRLTSALKPFPGAFVEDKRLTLSVHYREMDSRNCAALRALLARSLKPFSGSLKLTQGLKTWEIRPRADWNKGHALLKIGRWAGRPNNVLFAGDDRTDEECFRQLGPRAITIKIGRAGITSARFRLARQDNIRRLLERLCGDAP